MLKERIYKYLSDPEGISHAIQYRSGEPRAFLGICKTVLKYSNLFSQEAEGCTLGNGLRIDVSRKEWNGRLPALFHGER